MGHAILRLRAISFAGLSEFSQPILQLVNELAREAAFPEPEFDLYIKAESEQPIGSFKLRGAYNMVAQLSPEALKRGVQPIVGVDLLGHGTIRRRQSGDLLEDSGRILSGGRPLSRGF